MRLVLSALTLLLATGASASAEDWIEAPGKFAGYQDFLADTALAGIEKGVPDMPPDVRRSFAQCLAEASVTPLPPATLMPLDAAARGERAVPRGKSMLVEAVLAVKVKDAAAGKFDWAEPYCSGDIAAFKKYL
jgi:hypothetical protein